MTGQQKGNILILDDNLADLRLLFTILGNQGYTVRPNLEVTAALAAIKAELPDLILLDVNLPEMEGYEVCRRLKADPASTGVPVIFISASNVIFDKVKAFTSGGVDYITKPYQPEDVLVRVGLQLSLRKMQQELEVRNSQLQIEIGERTRAEKTLRESEEHYRLLAENATDVIFKIGHDHTLLYVSPACRSLFGYEPEEMEGRDGLDFIYPADREQVQLQSVALFGSNGTDTIAFRYLCKNGQYIWLESTARVVAASDKGQPPYIVAVSRDITERRVMEEALFEQEKLRLALHKEQELSELKSKMMIRIAHEFRTPLSVIQSSSETLQLYLDRMTPEKRAGYIGKIKSRIQHITSILDDLAFLVNDQYYPDNLIFTRLRLGNLCQQLVAGFETSNPDQNIFLLECESEVKLKKVDQELLSKALNHLLLNASKYSACGSRIWVTVGEEAGEAVITVRDEGIGITEEDQKRVFEPFYRGSNIDEVGGIGLGLSLVKRVVDLHRGTIQVTSKLHQGTIVTIKIPLCPPDFTGS